MGIYGVKSNTCNCKGSWCTLTDDHRIYMEKPCDQHSIKEGNIIYYELIHLLNHIIKNKVGILIEDVYPVKILQVAELGRGKEIIKVEVNHQGKLNTNNFDTLKQTYFSQMSDEPMWKKIDDNTFHFILLYKACHHNVEDKWDPFDY
jgi:hypothetical protein